MEWRFNQFLGESLTYEDIKNGHWYPTIGNPEYSIEYVKELEKKKDKGPFKVVYGSQHSIMPSISAVKVGDIIYPVTIINGTLAVMARLYIEKIECAFDYVMRELGTYHSALIPEGVLYYTEGLYGRFVMLKNSSGYVVDDTTIKYNGAEGEIYEKLPDNHFAPHKDALSPHPVPQSTRLFLSDADCAQLRNWLP